MKGLIHACLCTLALLLIGQSVTAKTAYKSQDDSGKIIYSDQPTPNSQEIALPPKQAPAPEPLAPVSDIPVPLSTTEHTNQASNDVMQYKAVMLQPKTEMVFTHEQEDINVKLFLEPQLHPNDRIQLKSNGKPLAGFHETTDFTIPRLDRGQYDLQAFVISKSGKGKPKGQTEVIRIHQIRNHIPRRK